MAEKNKKMTRLKWIEFIRLRSTAIMLNSNIHSIKKMVVEIEGNTHEASPLIMQHALYDGDLAIVIIWNNSMTPEKSREGLMLANKLEKLGAVDHAVWIPTGNIPGKDEKE